MSKLIKIYEPILIFKDGKLTVLTGYMLLLLLNILHEKRKQRVLKKIKRELDNGHKND